jgi:hypothetical protein
MDITQKSPLIPLFKIDKGIRELFLVMSYELAGTCLKFLNHEIFKSSVHVGFYFVKDPDKSVVQ